MSKKSKQNETDELLEGTASRSLANKKENDTTAIYVKNKQI